MNDKDGNASAFPSFLFEFASVWTSPMIDLSGLPFVYLLDFRFAQASCIRLLPHLLCRCVAN